VGDDEGQQDERAVDDVKEHKRRERGRRIQGPKKKQTFGPYNHFSRVF